VRLVFAGTPEVAAVSLAALLDSTHEVVAVITRPDAAAGRGRRPAPSAVSVLAAQRGLPVLTPARASDPEVTVRLTELAPDCAAVVAYGNLIPPDWLTVPRHGWVNLHFSLLPAWRGAAPVQRAVMAGDEVTGATTFRLEATLDTGPVFGVITEPIGDHDTSGEVLDRLAVSGARLLVATLDGIQRGDLHPEPQRLDGVSYAPKLSTDDAQVEWGFPAVHLDRLVRACTPAPGAWTWFRGERLKIGPVRQRPDLAHQAAGVIEVRADAVLVGSASHPLALGWVQAPGRRSVAATDWARGARLGPMERFGADRSPS
jgi:methionyl-tRNA formyltransferase